MKKGIYQISPIGYCRHNSGAQSNRGDEMNSNLERFKERMEPARKLYAREIRDFAKRYDALGEMTTAEFPDIDVEEYIFEFVKADGTSQAELDRIILEIDEHMEEFSKDNGIEHFCQWACIWI